MSTTTHLNTEQLEAGLDHIRQSPKDAGRLEMIVRRPQVDTREVLEEGALDQEQGLVGDSWRARGSSRMADHSAHPDMQLNIINARLLDLVAQDKARWQLAGDQLVVELDLSAENVPPGTRLAIGAAVVEVTAEPHTGCQKFVSRFGLEAMLFVNSPLGKQLHLRGINAKVVQTGAIHVGDLVTKIEQA